MKFENFIQNHQSVQLKNVEVRYSILDDVEEITNLIKNDSNESNQTYKYILARTLNEIKAMPHNDQFFLLTACYSQQVVGFARAMYLSQKKIIKAKYMAPIGWYLMGISVHSKYRGQGIGGYLIQERLNLIKKMDSEVYYFVDKKNNVSIHMHEKFHFSKIEESDGYFNVSFSENKGSLYRLCFVLFFFNMNCYFI